MNKKEKKPKIFTWSNRVYFGDTDAAGVVYHGKYIYWLEAARIEFLDAVGCPYAEIQAAKIGLIPVEINIKYLAPLRFGEYFTVELWVEEISRISVTIGNRVQKDGQPICSAQVKLACIDENTWKLTKIPEKLLACFNQF